MQCCARISVVVRLNNVLIFLPSALRLHLLNEMASMDRVKWKEMNEEPVEIPEFLLSLDGR